MPSAEKAYQKIFQYSQQLATLSSIEGLLFWDQETYLPKGAIGPRSKQLALIAEIIHKRQIKKSFGAALEKLIDLKSGKVRAKELSASQKAALREWRRDYLLAAKLPPSFVKEFTQICSEATHVWAKARKENLFTLFQPHLEKIVKFSQEKAKILGYEKEPYDALLDIYEPCMTTAKLTPLFNRLKIGLEALLKKIEKKKQPDDSFLYNNFSKSGQKRFCESLLKAMALDKNYSRLDISTHPFSISMHPHDTRLTIRYDKKYLMTSLLSALHEGGHCLYETGLPENYFGSPLGQAVSLGIHESQSRLWETFIGKGRPFWSHFYPLLQKEFKELRTVSCERFYKGLNKAAPSYIRVEADEATYSLHIILRFEIEKALINGKIKVADVPDLWNEKMQKYLHITPPSFALGCLQDIHWAMGSFGYFPTYALGNIYAAQIFEKQIENHPNRKEQIEKGELAALRLWLKENIHQYGRQYSAEELIKRITGKPLGEEDYLKYLNRKFTDIYDL